MTKDRIKALRKSLDNGQGINQAAFAERLGVSVSSAQKWEIGAAVPNSATLKLMADKFGVSEEWLRTGSGEMIVPRTREEEILDFVSKSFSDSAMDFRRRLLSVLCRLPDDAWDVLEKIVEQLEKEG